MPIAFRCSSCAQVLKVPDTMAGGKGKCPKCGAVLLIPGAKNAAPEAPARPAARKPRPPEPAAIEEKALRTRPRAAAASDDGGDAAEETAPRVRDVRKKKKRKSSPVLLFGLLGGGCAVLLLMCSGIGGLAWWYFFSSSIDDDLKYMPSNCQMVTSVRWDQLMQSEVFKELRREIPEIDKGMNTDINKEVGLSSDDIEQMVVGVGATPKEFTLVVRTKKAVDARDLRSRIQNAQYKETKIGKYLLQVPQNDSHPTFCVVDKKRIVAGEMEAVQAVLSRDKKPEFSKNLQAAMKEVDFSKTLAFAMDTQFARSQASTFGPFGQQKDVLGVFGKMSGIAVQSKISSEVDLKMVLLCQDAATANDVKKLIDGFLATVRNVPNMPKEFGDLLDLNLKVDGSKVAGNKTFKVGPLIKVYKQQKNPAPLPREAGNPGPWNQPNNPAQPPRAHPNRGRSR